MAERTADDAGRVHERLAVAVLDDYQGVAERMGPWERLAGRVEVHAYRDHLADRAALVERLRDYEVIVAMRERTTLDRSLVEQLPRLRLVVTAGAHNAVIDVAACAERGVTVCGTGGVGHGTAELTWALILAAARHLPEEVANMRSGRWMTTVGTDLHGARLGVIGLGRLGGQVAGIGLAFGMDVVAWSENLTEQRCAEVGVAKVTRDELLSSSDFVTIHLVLSERSRGLIGERELALLKPSAWLVNTSRGPICDEEAIVSACAQGRIAGACLDVFAGEPLPADHPFRKLPNVVATPHIGYVTLNGYERFFTDIVEDIEGWLAGEPLRVIRP